MVENVYTLKMKSQCFTTHQSIIRDNAFVSMGYQCYIILGIQPVRCTGFIKIWLNIINFYYNIFIIRKYKQYFYD